MMANDFGEEHIFTTNGVALNYGEVERALGLLARGEHVRLEGIGHGLYHEDREKVVEVIREFFRRW